ncbi:MAG TPA: DUF5703 domain-containing protein [Clostridia bacterium]|nr:MAG: hypothetical protein BWX97_00239 [Firmicutes bacterium ADurb.Bin146]HOD92290.1 DUF5703 domain-containing protein [Clostridia bacterium]HQM38713.1 DUF5703 domain-containing protein [Clostridia bacterium]
MNNNISSYDYRTKLFDSYDKFIPIGNGRIGASVWMTMTEKTDINLLLSATNNFSELGRILKTCKSCISISPNVFDSEFEAHLDLEKAILTIRSKKAEAKIYIDANKDVLCFSIKSEIPVHITYMIDNYRNQPLSSHDLENDFSNYAMSGSARFHNISESADIVRISNNSEGIIQYHRNEVSCYEYSYHAQNLYSKDKDVYRDPYINRTFGTFAVSNNLNAVNRDGHSVLTTEKAVFNCKIQIWSLTEKTDSVQSFEEKITNAANNFNESASYEMHIKNWKEYWTRYYIYAYGSDEAIFLTRAWIYQKYFNGCAGRGPAPIKFNGSLFVTYPHEVTPGRISWDYRRWGAAFWIQNTRHIYWNMLLSGDFEKMAPLYDLMSELIPISKHRSFAYYSHNGMLLPETFTIGGLYCMSNYCIPQEDNKRYEKGTWLHLPGQIGNHYIRWHYNGMLELAYLMLLGAKYSKNNSYLQTALEFSKETLIFFYEHFDTLDGKILMKPVSALETYQDCVNDLPDIAGLDTLTSELNECQNLPSEILEISNKIRDILVDYPKDDYKLLPCHVLIDKKRRNSENPELYSIFPFYRHTYLDKEHPLFNFAVNAFHERNEKAGKGWSQDCIQSALLGLTEEAKAILLKQAKMTDERYSFTGIYGPNYDETPDQDHANGISIGFIHTLLASSKDKNLLFGAWPKEWNVSFKLPLYSSKSVTCEYENGKIKYINFEDKEDERKAEVRI